MTTSMGARDPPRNEIRCRGHCRAAGDAGRSHLRDRYRCEPARDPCSRQDHVWCKVAARSVDRSVLGCRRPQEPASTAARR